MNNRRKKRNKRIIIGFFVVVILVSVIGFFVGRKQSRLEKTLSNSISMIEYYIIKKPISFVNDIFNEYNDLKDVYDDVPDIVEDGKTFKENALIKAKYVADDLHKIVLADDSGIEIDAFGKLPGIYSARFLGKDTPYPIINQAIIDAIEGKERTCRFVCALALCIPDQEPILIQETFEGEIHDHIAGVNGFGYDPIFYFPPCQKTSAEMTLEEKNKYSHRAKALKKLYAILKEL